MRGVSSESTFPFRWARKGLTRDPPRRLVRFPSGRFWRIDCSRKCNRLRVLSELNQTSD